MISEDNQYFKARRRKVLESLPSQAIALIFSNELKTRNRDVEYPFRQDSNFLYLTGFNEPDSILVLIAGRSEGEEILFCRPKHHSEEIWQGRRLGLIEAKKQLAVDDVIPIKDFQDTLSELIVDKQVIYLNLKLPATQYRLIQPFLCPSQQTESTIESLHEIDSIIHPLRVLKQPEEIKNIEKACHISMEAHKKAMKACMPGVYEYTLEAALMHEFIRQGARFVAYESIVAAGENGCILHYNQNTSQIQKNDLVLIDAGCEWNGYAADITRTFPASGQFSPSQRAIYELVLKTQLAIIEVLKPGQYWSDMYHLSAKLMTQGLIDLGILKGDLLVLLESGAIRRFYMHGLGHFLGLDVHDVGNMKQHNKKRALEPGMVLTVEPGLYFDPHDETLEKKWRGISVRIEDNVLITETGVKVLTADLTKTVSDIEQWMQASTD